MRWKGRRSSDNIEDRRGMAAPRGRAGIGGGGMLNLLPTVFRLFGVKGGIESAFMSATTDREVAIAYAASAGAGFIFEIKQGMIDRGADIEWLSQYPRYMKALRTRLERLRGQYEKDRKNMATLAALQAPLDQALQARPALLSLCAPARDFRWMLEEFRVSLFAQNLGTRRAVSAKRLQEQWQAVAIWLRDNPHD